MSADELMACVLVGESLGSSECLCRECVVGKLSLNCTGCVLLTGAHFFSFSVCMPFISFSCLIAKVRMSSNMLSKSGKSKTVSCLGDREKVSHLCCSVVLDRGALYMLFIKLTNLSIMIGY